VEPAIAYLPPRQGDLPHSLADISKARALLGYEPAVSLTLGLRRTWDYFAAQRAESARPAERSSRRVLAS